MSLLFSQDTAEQCKRCFATQFTISTIVQVTSDKKEQHTTGYLMECVACGNKHILEKDYFSIGRR